VKDLSGVNDVFQCSLADEKTVMPNATRDRAVLRERDLVCDELLLFQWEQSIAGDADHNGL
jgi:hypothetical protein